MHFIFIWNLRSHRTHQTLNREMCAPRQRKVEGCRIYSPQLKWTVIYHNVFLSLVPMIHRARRRSIRYLISEETTYFETFVFERQLIQQKAVVTRFLSLPFNKCLLNWKCWFKRNTAWKQTKRTKPNRIIITTTTTTRFGARNCRLT